MSCSPERPKRDSGIVKCPTMEEESERPGAKVANERPEGKSAGRPSDGVGAADGPPKSPSPHGGASSGRSGARDESPPARGWRVVTERSGARGVGGCGVAERRTPPGSGSEEDPAAPAGAAIHARMNDPGLMLLGVGCRPWPACGGCYAAVVGVLIGCADRYVRSSTEGGRSSTSPQGSGPCPGPGETY